MAKQSKLDEALKARNPLERQVIKPIDVLETEEPNATSERNERTDTPNNRTERPNRTVEPKNRTQRANDRTERVHHSSESHNRTVFDELQEGATEEEKRATERYSFEIYTDQKGSIEELQYLYKKKTGKKLSASRIIREALEEYLDRALSTLKQEE